MRSTRSKPEFEEGDITYCTDNICKYNNYKKHKCFKRNKWNRKRYLNFKVEECPSRWPEEVRFKKTNDPFGRMP